MCLQRHLSNIFKNIFNPNPITDPNPNSNLTLKIKENKIQHRVISKG